MSASHLIYRAQQKRAVRSYLDRAGLAEVDVPLLARNACPDPHVEPITLLWKNIQVFLQPSPELFLKRLLSQHPIDMYSLGPCFRDDPSTPLHNPEFLMLEFYLLGQHRYRECQQHTANIAQLFKPSYEIEFLDYQQIWEQHFSCWPSTPADYAQLFAEHDRDFPDHWELQDWHDLLFAQIIQPQLGQGKISIVSSFPAEQAALAQIDHSGKAERFEVFVDGTEIANGYHELTDKQLNSERFAHWRTQREQSAQPFWDDDGKFIESLEDLPPCSGVAIGIERLILLGSGLNDINQSLSFPWKDC